MNIKLKKALGLNKPKTLISTLIIVGVILFAFPKYVVTTESMTPTIPKGSYVVSIRQELLQDDIQKGDILVFDPVEGISPCPWIHRVIGLSGEAFTLYSRKGRRDIENEHSISVKKDISNIPKGYIYQGGDSDTSYYGLVNKKLIRGKVLFHFKLPWN